MSNVRVESQTLTDIADSIRSKLGVETTYKPGDMAGAIDSIPSGITPTGTINITTNGAHDVTNYAEAEVNVPTNEIYYSVSGRAYTVNMVMPDTVTSIDGSSYADCTNLVNMQMSDSITGIDKTYCFARCSNLEELMLPINATGTIGIGFCLECFKLKSVNIPDGITRLLSQTFQGCSKLDNIYLPNGLTSIGSYCFSGCGSLSTIYIPATVTSINNAVGGMGSFRGCSALKNVTLGEGFLTTINLSVSTKFTADDIVVMFNSLGTVPEGETRTFTLGAMNLAKLSAEQKAIATDKGWTLS